ncbi:MAG: SsrA-binding protein SmpB [Dehalococcoidia bacterium]
MSRESFKVITVNRQARRDYEILETVEAGLVLTGTEIKSIRDGRVNIRDAYARRMDGEMWLFGAHIGQYPSAARNNHEPGRPRKLLLHRDQIEDLAEQVEAQGLTLVPMRLYIRNHRAKVELGVGRGRKKYDKRQAIAKRDADRRIRQATRVRI